MLSHCRPPEGCAGGFPGRYEADLLVNAMPNERHLAQVEDVTICGRAHGRGLRGRDDDVISWPGLDVNVQVSMARRQRHPRDPAVHLDQVISAGIHDIDV